MKRLNVALCLAGLLAVVGAPRAEEKKVAKGTFTMNGTTYKVVSALAYSTTVRDQKQTVVILADKPLNAAQLRAALKKNEPRDFDPYPRLALVFDDKGVLLKMDMQTQDAGIRGLPASDIKDHKATATITEGAAKGTAATVGKEDREAINGHKYRFDVTFDVALTKP
jgi:hypothetical protein